MGEGWDRGKRDPGKGRPFPAAHGSFSHTFTISPFPGSSCSNSILRPLLRRMRLTLGSPLEIERCCHERDMRERLRKIAEKAPLRGIVFLGEESHVVPQPDEPLEERARLGLPPRYDVGIG